MVNVLKKNNKYHSTDHYVGHGANLCLSVGMAVLNFF